MNSLPTRAVRITAWANVSPRRRADNDSFVAAGRRFIEGGLPKLGEIGKKACLTVTCA
jgi:hypothetical protein